MSARGRLAYALVTLGVAAACSGKDEITQPPPPVVLVGTLVVSVQASGLDQDADGYSVMVDAIASHTLAASSGVIRFVGLATGAHTVTLGDLAANCSVKQPNPNSAEVRQNAETALLFEVNCEGIPASARISWRYPSLFEGDTAQLTATIFSKTGATIAGPVVSWRSAEPAIATVSAGGVVTGNANGRVWVVASLGQLVDSVEIQILRINPSPRHELTYLTVDHGIPWRLVRSREDGSSAVTMIYGDFSEYEWSYDGNFVVAAYAAPGTSGLITKIHDANGAIVRNFGTYLANAAWSPDGTSLAYRRAFAFGESDISLVNLSTGVTTVLTDDPGDEILPRWSPDGRQILYVRGPLAAQPELWIMRTDGSDKRFLAFAGGTFATWSPDGKLIAFAGGPGIRLINADGSRVRQLTGTCPAGSTACTANDFYARPSWSRDGRSLGVVRQGPLESAYFNLISTSGTTLVSLTLPGVRNSTTYGTVEGALSPDGALVAMLGEGANGISAYSFATDGTRLQRASPIDQTRSLSWRP